MDERRADVEMSFSSSRHAEIESFGLTSTERKSSSHRAGGEFEAWTKD